MVNCEFEFGPAVLNEVQQGQLTPNVHWVWMTKANCFLSILKMKVMAGEVNRALTLQRSSGGKKAPPDINKKVKKVKKSDETTYFYLVALKKNCLYYLSEMRTED